MKRTKKVAKNIFILVVSLTLLLVIWIAYFIIKNDAPLISGNMEYGVPFKEGLELDIYRPTQKVYESSPILFYIHGGAWIGGNKITVNNNRFNGAINQLRAAGYTIISPNYTLAENGKSPFPNCILDVYDAIDWTKAHAKAYQLDTTNIGLLGESAGGHIAMMIAFPDTTFIPKKYHKTTINYLIDVYGPNDLEGIYRSKLVDSLDVLLKAVPEHFRDNFDMKKQIFGFDPKTDTLRANQMIAMYSPYYMLHHFNKPVLLIHGKNDRIVPVKQSLDLKKRLDSLRIKNEMHLLDDVDHGFIGAKPEQMDAVQQWIYDFVIQHHISESKIPVFKPSTKK